MPNLNRKKKTISLFKLKYRKFLQTILEDKFLIPLIVLTLLFGVYSAIYWEENYKFYSADLDMASELNVLYNSVRGDMKTFFFSSIHEGYFFIVDHFNLSFLLFIFIFWLNPINLTYFFLNGIVLAIGSIPIYKISEVRLKSRILALMISLFYLFNPILIYFLKIKILIRTYSAIPFLLFTFYFYEKKNFKLFTIFLLLSVFTKENIGLIAITMGFYLLYKEKNKKWGLMPVILGGISFIVFLAFTFGLYDYMFPNMGHMQFFGGEFSKGENLIITDFIERILSTSKSTYLIEIFSLFGFVPLLGIEILFVASPKLLENLLYGQKINMYLHNNAILIPFLFISFIYGLERIKRILDTKTSSGCSKFIMFFIITLLIVNATSNRFNIFETLLSNNKYISENRQGLDFGCKTTISNYNKRWDGLIEIKSKIPESVGLLVDRSLNLEFAERKYLYVVKTDWADSLPIFLRGHREVGYALFNKELIDCLKEVNISRASIVEIVEITKVNITSLVASPEWGQIEENSGFILFKRI